MAMVLSAPFIAVILAYQSQPMVPQSTALSAADLSEVESLLLENAPRSTYQVTQQQVSLNADELNLLLRYGISTIDLKGHWAAELALANSAINTQATVGYEIAGFPAYFNLSAVLESNGRMVEIKQLRLGKLNLPASVIQFLLQRAQSTINSSSMAAVDLQALIDNVESLVITNDVVQAELQWDPVLMGRLSDQTQQLFVSDQERERVAYYYQVIGEIIAATPLDIRAISLNTLFTALFSEALARTDAGEDAVKENRALLQALAIYVNEEALDRFFGNEMSERLEQVKFIEVRLQRRQDLAQHVASTASITASAGADVAAMVSTTKEAYDARYRSGFSFSDLTANTVGVKLAVLATKDAESAQRLQRRMVALKTESEYMPATGDSRDGLSESDFAAIYQDRNSVQYREKMDQIESLVINTPVFVDMGLNPPAP